MAFESVQIFPSIFNAEISFLVLLLQIASLRMDQVFLRLFTFALSSLWKIFVLLFLTTLLLLESKYG